MQVILYKITCEDNVIDKVLPDIQTATASEIKILTGSLRDNTSIINPSLIVEGVEADDVVLYNYMYIPAFKRYYFIKNITFLKYSSTTSGGVVTVKALYQIDCHVDVLKSFEEELMNCIGFVERSASINNFVYDDNQLMTYKPTRKATYKFNAPSNATDEGTSYGYVYDTTTQKYVNSCVIVITGETEFEDITP